MVCEQVCLGSDQWRMGRGNERLGRPRRRRSEAKVPSLSFSTHRCLCPRGGSSPLLLRKEASPSCTPTALPPPSLLVLSPPACMLCHLWLLPLASPAGPGPHLGSLTCTCPCCGGCSVLHDAPLPSSPASPAGPTPFQKLRGGAGGQGRHKPPGWRGTGESLPCFLLLLTNPPFLCLD